MSEIQVDPETGEVLEGTRVEDEFNALGDGDGEPEAIDNTPEPETEFAAVEDTGPSMEAIIKLGRSFDTYGKRVTETYGDDMQYIVACPCCPDNHKGFVDLRWAGNVPPEVSSEVYAYLTATNVGSFEQDPGTKTCPVCAGKTQVRTGALSGQWITRTCPNCGGYGFMPPPSNAVGSLGASGNGGVQAEPTLELVAQEDVDEWGEPRVLPDGTLNANFGMMPNRKTIHPVYGVTSTLTAQAVS